MLSYIGDRQFTWSCKAHTLVRCQGAPKVKEPTVSKNHGLTKYNCETESNRSKEKKFMVFGVISLFFFCLELGTLFKGKKMAPSEQPLIGDCGWCVTSPQEFHCLFKVNVLIFKKAEAHEYQ